MRSVYHMATRRRGYTLIFNFPIAGVCTELDKGANALGSHTKPSVPNVARTRGQTPT